ncbi:MAG: HlyD family efflux transporter periplasmic adaptor subunit [Leptolyngbyaceae bacterium]|nr:HlyD family efflux transporter periplasmic adaptor subunit [Leptolyngbyaceae bacterium]
MNDPVNESPFSLATHPLSPDEFLPPVSRWTTLGGAILISAVGAAVILATTLRYNITVKAPGVVRPSGELRLVQAERDGTVVEIAVSANQSVQRGEVIARLNTAPLETQQRQLEGTLQQSQVQLAQINAQLQLMDAQIEAEGRSLDQEIAVAQSEVSRSQQESDEQQATTQANLDEAEANLAFARSEVRRYEQLVDSGAVAQLQLEEKQAAAQAAEAQVARARSALNPSRAPVAIAQDRLTQEQSRRRAILATLTRERESLVQRQSELEAQVLADQQALQQTELDLQKMMIRAPHDGIIHQLALRNVNQVVQASETLAAIAPTTEGLTIRARVAPQDIDRVEQNQPVQMRVSACPYPDFGTLSGTVTAISPDAIANPTEAPATETSISNLSTTPRYYDVTIQPDTTQMGKGDRPCRLQPGMEVEASIISRQESVMEFILRKARLITQT